MPGAGALVDVRAAASETGDLHHNLFHVLRDGHLTLGIVLEVRALLFDDGDLGFGALRVVRSDLGAVAVLERGDDAAAVGVVLRVGGGNDENIEGETDAVAADLDVALFHDVEEADLDAFREVREFVDAEDATIVAGDEAVVDGEFVGEVAALGDLDRVDLTDKVGDGDVRGGELLAVAALAVDPFDLGVVAFGVEDVAAAAADGVKGAVVDLAAADRRDLVVEEGGEGADEARLSLSTLAEKDDVLTG